MRAAAVILGIAALLFAKDAPSQRDIYMNYTDKIMSYGFEIPNLDKIKNPFVVHVAKKRKNRVQKIKRKYIKFSLISIFDNKVYVKIEKYLGEQLIDVKKKWIKPGDKVGECRLVKVTTTNAFFNCKGKTVKKTVNTKINMLRD